MQARLINQNQSRHSNSLHSLKNMKQRNKYFRVNAESVAEPRINQLMVSVQVLTIKDQLKKNSPVSPYCIATVVGRMQRVNRKMRLTKRTATKRRQQRHLDIFLSLRRQWNQTLIGSSPTVRLKCRNIHHPRSRNRFQSFSVTHRLLNNGAKQTS